MSHTLITPKARAQALACARGEYQVGLLAGSNSWSGSDLTGTARRYGGRYRDSREILLDRVRGAGLYAARIIGQRGRIRVVIMTAAERRRAGDKPPHEVVEEIIARAEKAKAAAERKAAREQARAQRELEEDLPTLEMLAEARW